MNILVSACLTGLCTRYDGRANTVDLAALDGHTLIPVCPEQLGGLPTPRPCAERQRDGHVLDIHGRDITLAFENGAREAWKVYVSCRCQAALLKSRSPSCGVGSMYDGTFSNLLVPGNGVFAQWLLDHRVPVFSEDQVEALAAYVG